MEPCSAAAASLTAATRRALAAAGIPEAAAGPGRGLAPAGFLAAPLRALGPDRVAVTWHDAGVPQPCQPRPGPGLGQCRAALDALGYRTEYVVAPDGGYLAVLAPAGTPAPWSSWP